MKRQLMHKVLIATIICLFSYSYGYGEVKINVRDTAAINDNAREAITKFQDLLNLLVSNDYESSAKNYAIGNSYNPSENYFKDGKASIENDLDPANSKPGAQERKIEEYLPDFNGFFKPTKESPVEFTVKNISSVKTTKDGDYMYVKLYFNEMLNGTTQDGKVHGAVKHRVAEFAVTKQDGKWKAAITSIRFDGGGADEGIDVQLTGGEETQVEINEGKPETYYSYLLELGTRTLNEHNFTDAFYELKHAALSSNSATKKAAYGKITELINKMKTEGNFEASDDISKNLIAKSQNYEKDYKYEDARRCLEYALGLVPTNKSIAPKIREINEKWDVQRKLESMYRNGQYDQAITGYTKAISESDENPYLYSGRAKCYAKIGEDNKAMSDFVNSTRLDKTNADLWKDQAYFCFHRKTPAYERAYSAFTSFLSFVEDKNDPSLNEVYLELTYLKGRVAYEKRNYPEALDSLSKIVDIKKDYDNGNAILYQGLCHLNMNENDKSKALRYIDLALNVNEKLGEAHYWKGKINYDLNPKANEESYVSELKLAIQYEPTNTKFICKWNYELGRFYSDKGMFLEALPFFNNCINANGSETVPAYWPRGLCFYKQNIYDRALEDYEMYEKKGLALVPKFYVDFGNVYLMKNDATKAKEYFSKGNSTPEAQLGMAEAYYLENPSDKKRYLDQFEMAFKGISEEVMKADPFVIRLNDDAEFKKLRKKYRK